MKIFAGNLSPSVDEEALQQAASPWGEVLHISITRDPSGQSRGFGFIEMATTEGGQALLSHLNGTTLQGQPLKLSEARPEKRALKTGVQTQQTGKSGPKSTGGARPMNGRSKGGFNVGLSGRNKV